ncbi:unnamed protein product, partial [Mesorhabditis belari]|uniref:Uncharacterized protein n=1 Tax=Mesorhabditis belari TaxID=2138241 RepID=A0AAF3FQI5_9BILA
MTTTAYEVAGWLEKMDSPDKALSLELIKRKQGYSQIAEVVGGQKRRNPVDLTVRCLATVVARSKDPQADFVVDSLCTNLTAQKPELRDVSSVALKTVVSELPTGSSQASNIVSRLTPQLSKVLRDNPEIEAGVRMEMLDILADVLFRYGGTIAQHHNFIKDVLLQVLASSTRQAIRKRTINCLGSLCSCCDAEIFEEISAFLLDKLNNSPNEDTVQTLSTAFASRKKQILLASPGIFHRFDVLPRLRRSWRKLKKVALEFLCHDPNYCGDSDDEGMDGEDEDDDQDFSDDDDVSWKVRRSAAKVIEALIVSRREHMKHSITAFGPILIGRLKEREETVRIDVVRAYISLLRQISTFIPSTPSATGGENKENQVIGYIHFAAGSLSNEQLELLKAIQHQVPTITKAVAKLLKNRSTRTKTIALALLTHLSKLCPDHCLINFLPFCPLWKTFSKRNPPPHK